MLNKLKARKSQLQAKGGFTLVELIVVLVILAILAALLIPALTGYIDKAKEKSAVAECRQVVMAAQTLLDEDYANNKAGNGFADDKNTDGKQFTKEETKKLADVTGDIGDVTTDGKKITKIVYTAKSGKKCTYTWNETDKTGSYKTETK